MFSARALQRILDQRERDSLRSVPFFDGLLAGEVDALVESFAGVPEVHHPVRGRIKGEAAFRGFVAETSAWLRQHHASVDDVEHVILERRGFAEETAVAIRGLRPWITNEYEHNGLRADGERILGRLIDLVRGRA